MTEQKKHTRTIQVKIGNAAAKSMTPDQAADYLKSIAGRGWGTSRELKMTFDNGNTSSVTLPREKKLDGLCSEKEMKALMSMFVEVMSLQMNTEYLNNYPYRSPKEFAFPSDVPPPPGGWPDDLLWPQETLNETSSLPGLEDIPDIDKPQLIALSKQLLNIHKQQHPRDTTNTIDDDASDDVPVVSNKQGIAPFEWTQLERTAIEDALEQEERIRKEPSKTTTTTNSGSVPPKTTTLPKKDPPTTQPQPKTKRTKKEIVSWRNKVANAVQHGDDVLLEQLLDNNNNPLPPTTTDMCSSNNNNTNTHLEFLVPLVTPKSHHSDTLTTRLLLLDTLAGWYPKCLLTNLRRGRSALHSACLYGDLNVFMHLQSETYQLSFGDDKQLYPYCQESGYTSLFYACLSGNLHILESVLDVASDPRHLIRVPSNPAFTWRKGHPNQGIDVLYLLDALTSHKTSKRLETHGCANTEFPHTREYLKRLEAIRDRLTAVLRNGFVKRTHQELAKIEQNIAKELEQEALEQKKSSNSVSTASASLQLPVNDDKVVDSDDDEDPIVLAEEQPKKKKKKKKKKAKHQQQQQPGSSVVDSTSEEASKPKEDPLVTSLKGMGFEEDQIVSGIEACGGPHRATADTVVAWIFQQTEASKKPEPAAPAMSREESERRNQEAARQKQEERLAAERLAAKREEQRRRNREWNNRQKLAAAEPKRPSARTILPARGLSPTFGESIASSGGVPKPTPPQSTRKTASSTRLKPGGHLNLGPMGLDRNNSQDETTEVSSVDHGTIEVPANDDATVSTMGSFPAMNAPAPSFAPPGFNNNTEQWEPMHRSYSDSYHNNNNTTHSSSFNYGATPEIPESRPLLHAMPTVRSQSFSADPMVQNSRGPPYGAAPPEYGLGSSLLGGTAIQSNPAPTLLNRGLNAPYAGPPSTNAPRPPPMGAPVVPGLMGLNTASNDVLHTNLGGSVHSLSNSNLGSVNHPPPTSNLGGLSARQPASNLSGLSAQQPASNLGGLGPPHPTSMDSKLVESISTGHIGGSALWDTSEQGQSILGSLLNSPQPAPSLFGSSPGTDQWAGQASQQRNLPHSERNRNNNTNNAGGSIW